MNGFLFTQECEDWHLGAKDDSTVQSLDSSNLRMLRLLFELNVPFLMTNATSNGSLNEFILRKASDQPLKIPFRYDKLISNIYAQSGSGNLVHFMRSKPIPAYPKFRTKFEIMGDKKLYKGIDS